MNESGKRHLLWRLALLVVAMLASQGCTAIEAAIIEAPPYGMLRGGKAEGAYVEIVQAIGRESGLAIGVSVMPFARAIATVTKGDASFTLMFANDQIENGARRGALVTEVESVLVPGRGQQLDTPDQLHIGRLRGGCQDLVRLFGKAVFVELDDHRQGARLLNAGRIDAMCSTRAAISTAFKDQDLPEPDWSRALVTSTREVRIYTAAPMPEAQGMRLNKAVDALRMRGDILRIMHRWGE